MNEIKTLAIMDNISDQLEQAKFDPIQLQRTILEYLEEATNNSVKIMDASNPVSFLLEASVLNTTTTIGENIINLRNQYPSLSQNYDELFTHMSDLDHYGIFALPAKANITFMVNKTYLLNNIVPVSGTDYSQVIMPRNTEVILEDLTFSMQYPIIIRMYSNDNLVVMYDTSIKTPLLALDTKVINHTTRSDNAGTEYIFFNVSMEQFKIISNEFTITASSGFDEVINFNDDFYYVRIFNKSNATNGKWKEMNITFTEIIYDNDVPTAIFKVSNNKLQVRIPDIYIANGLTGTIRVDVYTTKGKLYKPLKDIRIKDYRVNYRIIDTVADSNIYTAPVPAIAMFPSSNDVVHGGQNSLTYDEVRDRVIHSALGVLDSPITKKQLEVYASRYGYELYKYVDIITNRIFTASRALPKPYTKNINTQADITIETIILDSTILESTDSVMINPNQYTIKSNSLFRLDNGKLSIVSNDEISEINLLPLIDRVSYINSNDLYFTPFYYIVNRDNGRINTRIYDLDNPKINYLVYESSNSELTVNVNTSQYVINKIGNTYEITVLAISDSNYKNISNNSVFVQLAIPISNTSQYIYINGEYITKSNNERLFKFTLNTTLNINNNNQINITNSLAHLNDIFIDMVTDAYIYYGTDSPNIAKTEFDINNELYNPPFGSQVISKEKININLGDYLEHAWSRSWINYSENRYRTYDADIPGFYTKDIFKIDPATNSYLYVDENCNLRYDLLHRKGDPMLTSDDAPVIAHHAGDTMLDHNGQPIVDNISGINMHIDLMLLESPYYFASNVNYIAYLKEIIAVMNKWIYTDLKEMNEKVLELTSILYSPVKSTGYIRVILDDVESVISAKHTPKITLYISKDYENNISVINKLKTNTKIFYNEELKNTVININNIGNTINEKLGDIVLGVKLEIPNTNNANVITMLDKNTRMSLHKRLLIDEDRKTSIDYVTVINTVFI